MYFVNISSELIYTVDSTSSFVFNIAAANTVHQQTVEENLTIFPPIDSEWFQLNNFGCRGLRLKVEPCELSVQYNATVQLSPEIEQIKYLNEVEHKRLPTAVLPFLSPSRYCESDRLGRLAWKEFGQLPGGYSRVVEICNWVNRHIDYVAGSTDASCSIRGALSFGGDIANIGSVSAEGLPCTAIESKHRNKNHFIFRTKTLCFLCKVVKWLVNVEPPPPQYTSFTKVLFYLSVRFVMVDGLIRPKKPE